MKCFWTRLGLTLFNTYKVMRIFKKILIWFLVCVGFLGLVIGGSMIYEAIDKEDSFYVVDAELSNANYLNEIEEKLKTAKPFDVLVLSEYQYPSVDAHRIKEGVGRVFGYRWFTRGNVFARDDERYEKITLWISPDLAQDKVIIDLQNNPQIVGVYTSGPSAWPIMACSGFISAGRVEVEKKGQAYNLRLDGVIEPRGVAQVGNKCVRQRIHKEFLAKKLPYQSLTPWLGR